MGLPKYFCKIIMPESVIFLWKMLILAVFIGYFP